MLLMIAAMIISFSFAQNALKQSEIPASIRTEFVKNYPYVESDEVIWEKERNNYKASFNYSDSYYVVEFNERGNKHMTRMSLKEHEVPAYVKDYASKNHPEEMYKEVEKITDINGKVSYKMMIKDKVYDFDSNGNIVKDTEKVKIKDTETVR